MSIQHLSHEWYVREVDRLSQQLRNAENRERDMHRRNWMLVDFMAKKGLPLDEIDMRSAYEFETAGQIRLADDERRLEAFRRNTVMVVFDAENARGKVSDTELLEAILKTLKRSIDACGKKAMSAETAREKAREGCTERR